MITLLVRERGRRDYRCPYRRGCVYPMNTFCCCCFCSNFLWSPSLIMSRVRWTIFTFFISFSLRLLNLYTVDEPYGLITVDYSIRCVINIYNKMDDRSCQFGAKSRQGFFLRYISENANIYQRRYVPILMI